MARSDEWTDDEVVLALAACPRERQSYSPRHGIVIELADLIGRTPGAVSHHFANISHLIHGGTHGETHVGSRTRELFDRYARKDEELQARAREIRSRLMAEDPTPRVEKRLPRSQTRQLKLEAFDTAKAEGIPVDGVQVYEREGSWYFGVIMNLSVVLVGYPEQATKFLLWLGRRLGERFTRSKGFSLAVLGRWQQIADQVVAREAPAAHLKELRPQDRVTLALRIPLLGSLRRWRPTKRHLQSLSAMNRDGERKRVNAYLGIDSAGACDMCLLMLKDLVDQSVKRTHPPANR